MLTTLFKTDIYVAQYPDLEELSVLLNEVIVPLPFSRFCNEMVSLTPPFPPGVDSTTQHWLKNDPNHPPEFLHRNPRFSKIVEFINHHVKIFWDQLGYEPKITPAIAQTWCMRYPRHTHGLAIHNHANIPIVGTFCFAGNPEAGKVVFQHPLDMLLSQLPYASWGRNSRLKPIETTPGTLVLWPGYLQHAVSPNKSETTRYTWNLDFYVPENNPMLEAIKSYDQQSSQ